MTDTLATSDDTIYRGRLTLRQPLVGYRFGSDAMLLAACVAAKSGDRVLELGCGVGAVLLAAATRLQDVSFTGIEWDACYAALAVHNVTENKLTGRITILQEDLHSKELFHKHGLFDHVISNPPYYGDTHSSAPNALRRTARHEAGEGIAQWLHSANRFLQPKGSITLIYPTARLDEVMVGLPLFAGNITLYPLWPQQGVSSKRVLIRATKGSKAPLRLQAGLVLHHADGTLTEKANAVINDGQFLELE